MKRKNIIRNIAYIALFSALVFFCTYFIAIPYGGGAGYFNLSDGIILFSTIFFGPIVGFFSGIIGTILGDLAAGYAVFIPFTFLAKGLESIVCSVIFYALRKMKLLKYLSTLVSPLIMVATYFVSYIVLYGIEYAIVSSPFDVLQGLAGTIISIMLLLVFDKVKIPHFEYENIKFTLKKAN